MKNPVHPGAVLREDVIAELGIGVGEAVSRLGVPRVTLSRVLHRHARMSPNLAVRLERAGVGTARAWLAMPTAHDLAAARPFSDDVGRGATTGSTPRILITRTATSLGPSWVGTLPRRTRHPGRSRTSATTRA